MPGGWYGHPNSIATLRKYRVDLQDLPKCGRCRRVAVKGYRLCVMHLGRWSPNSNAYGRAESRYLGCLERLGLLPLELLALPVWRNLSGLPTAQRAPCRVELVRSWDTRYSAPLRWAQIQRKAMDIGQRQVKRNNTAWFYEDR